MNAMNLAIALSYIDPKYIEECKHNMLVKKATWIFCPICGSKTRTKVYEDTVVHNFPLYCPKCKTEVRVDITELKMTVSK